MKNLKIILIALIGVLAAGCYNDFDTPKPRKIYTDEDMTAMGLKHITIKEVKDKFGPISGTGENDEWADTKTLKFGAPSSDEAAKFPGTSFWEDGANYYIKGKVISTDEEGNIYKSLYIWDGTAAIELKLHSELFITYKLNLKTMESMWVYVRLENLYLGNYRMMLSIGDAPSDGVNVAGTHKYYANSNIENPDRVAKCVLTGEPCKLEAGDIKVVNSDNYTSLGEADFGRLVKFEKVKIRYSGVKNQDDDIPTPLKNGSNENPYPSWIVTDWGTPQFGAWYYWAYHDVSTNVSLYGSVLMVFNEDAEYTSDKGVYSIRTSGYSRFSNNPIPKDGTVGNVLGIYGIYSKQSDYKGGARDYAQYQISVCRYADLDFPKESLLDEEWIKANTPASSYDPPVKNSTGDFGDYD